MSKLVFFGPSVDNEYALGFLVSSGFLEGDLLSIHSFGGSDLGTSGGNDSYKKQENKKRIFG